MKRLVFLFFIDLWVYVLAGQSANFDTNFQVLMTDSSALVCHVDMRVELTDSGLVVSYRGVNMLDYKLDRLDCWVPYDADTWYHIDSDTIYIVDVRERWLYAQTPVGKMQLYYEIPKTFEIKW